MADFLLQLPPVQQRRPRNYRFNANLLNYTDEELRARYRFGSESIQFITNLIETYLRRKTNRSHALRPIDQVLIALRFYASGNFLQVIGDTVGVDKSTVSRAVHDVSQLLSAKQNMFIKWPTTAAVINENKNGFYRRRRFPGIIGCIDGTQIRIIAPSNNESDFVNRKGFHSINVQGVCDHKGMFAKCCCQMAW
ncbi:putative nuclease HARBI1 [Acropora millepora]|uniref:putative nuclease HARBI1 n=1 Tax=Acropora millepora TaxID=45264 RepID=UPI001CF0EB81|nr:putative nuclease HARBI1 [Acropora millepora]